MSLQKNRLIEKMIYQKKPRLYIHIASGYTWLDMKTIQELNVS